MVKKNLGTLYCIATPLGNPQDMSPRARDILSHVSVIAAEDTRRFKMLCSSLDFVFSAKLLSYFDSNEVERSQELLGHLLSGEDVALVSDAGTPNIYDPGYRILSLAYENGVKVSPIPGGSSVTAALSICPLPGLNFCFYGFAPSTSSQRIKLFKEVNFEGRVVFFESPHRLKDHLRDASSVWGDDVNLFIARELTKNYEEAHVKTLGEWNKYFKEHSPKGEYVLIYEAHTRSNKAEDLDQWLQEQLKFEHDPRQILKEAQKRFKINRKEIYSKITNLKEKKK